LYSVRNGRHDVSVMKPDGSDQRNVSHRAQGRNGSFSWSSPGREQAFAVVKPSVAHRSPLLGTLAVLALLIAAATVAAGVSAMPRHASDTPPTLHRSTYKRQLAKLASDGHSGAAAIVVTPSGTWKGAAGWADFSTKRRAAPDNRFAIESTTKTFVATVVLQLVGEGRLTLHDTLQRWLPGLYPARPSITIRQLLNHTSGVPPDFGFSRPPRARATDFAAQGLLFKPGTSSAYSNSGYVLLGLIVEKVTGRSLDQVVTSRIIRHLQLRSTSYGSAHAQRMTPWLGPVESFGRPVSGDGGIISNVEDLATFFRALLGGKLLPQEQLAEMTRTIPSGFPGVRSGLGIFRKRFSCGYGWGHGGDLSYSVNVAVARDGSKAGITAQNNPALGDDIMPERLYCT
jgi:D-alanyl-D-alanine carboxypeptidase